MSLNFDFWSPPYDYHPPLISDEDRVGNSLLQIWKLTFGTKAKLLFKIWAQGLVKILKLKFRQDFEAGVWILVEILKLGLVKILNFIFAADVL